MHYVGVNRMKNVSRLQFPDGLSKQSFSSKCFYISLSAEHVSNDTKTIVEHCNFYLGTCSENKNPDGKLKGKNFYIHCVSIRLCKLVDLL